ncbi:hypothetical protein GCM10027277_46730 [Pseudoduganella ginsengisoli]|uniref:AlpA family phage regulatory protein n=1 Tax=Pseudoduganella ginsengisoli TaxID=1462440 RepID=A0A6L6Q4B9_9BURK|nr:AlpA family phage regulatory protein [Pseudoduganella ginsengisoli]
MNEQVSGVRCLTVKEVAQKCGVSVSTIWNWVKLKIGFPDPFSIGPNTTRWQESAIDAYILSCIPGAMLTCNS